MHLWPAKAIPWLQKFSLVEVGQCSIVCIWDVASRVRTSAHCVSSLGASGLRLIIPLGIMPVFLEKVSDSPTALYHIWHLEDKNPFWVPSLIVSEFLILTKLIHESTARPSARLVISVELHFSRISGNPISGHPKTVPIQMVSPLRLQNQKIERENRHYKRHCVNAGIVQEVDKLLSPLNSFAIFCPFLLILLQVLSSSLRISVNISVLVPCFCH